MTESTTIDLSLTARPAIVAALSPFGAAVAEELGRRLVRRHGRLPDWYRRLAPTPGPAGQLAGALTDVLSLRHASAGGAQIGPRAPLIVAVAAAAELDDRAGLDQFAQAARREFQRSCLNGTIAFLVYGGALADGRVPDEAVLRAIQEEDRLALKLVFTDTDANGWRISEGDACTAGVLILTALLETESLAAQLTQLVRGRSPETRLVAFGIVRVDLSEEALRRHLRRRLLDQARDILFPGSETPPEASPVPTANDLPTLAALREHANGSLRPVEATLDQAADRMADGHFQSLLHEAADQTQQALRELIPMSRTAAAPRPGFWQRLIAWLRGLWRGFWNRIRFRHRPDIAASPLPADTTRQIPPTRQSSAAWRDALTRAERHRFHLARLSEALGPGPTDVPDFAPNNPFELALGERPDLQEQIYARCAPSCGELAWALARAFPLSDVLNAERPPDGYRGQLQDVCEGLLKLKQWTRLLQLEDYRALLDRTAEAVCPLFRGRSSLVKRYALLPPRLASAYEAGNHAHLSGGGGGEEEAVTFLTVQAGVTIESLLGEEDQYYEHEPNDSTSTHQ